MNTKALSRQELTVQLKEVSNQIDLLDKKKTESELKILEYSKELVSLKTKQRDITHVLHHLEAPSHYMWENIGEGG